MIETMSETDTSVCANCGISRVELAALAEWSGGAAEFGDSPVCCETAQ